MKEKTVIIIRKTKKYNWKNLYLYPVFLIVNIIFLGFLFICNFIPILNAQIYEITKDIMETPTKTKDYIEEEIAEKVIIRDEIK